MRFSTRSLIYEAIWFYREQKCMQLLTRPTIIISGLPYQKENGGRLPDSRSRMTIGTTPNSWSLTTLTWLSWDMKQLFCRFNLSRTTISSNFPALKESSLGGMMLTIPLVCFTKSCVFCFIYLGTKQIYSMYLYLKYWVTYYCRFYRRD